MRGRLFFAIGRFIRERGVLSSVIFLSLFVASGNIFAQINDSVLLEGYWHDAQHNAQDTLSENNTADAGLALGDAGVTDVQQLAVDATDQDRAQTTDLSVLSDDTESLLADEAVQSDQYSGTDSFGDDRGETTIYTVEPGDTVESIARRHHLTPDTILWANELDDPNEIKPGDTLILLSVPGVQHKVARGDTLESIAKKYDAKKEDIIAFNDLPANGELRSGETITIPGGIKKAPPAPKKPLLQRRAYTASSVSVASQSTTTVRAGYFSRPIKGGRRSQGLHPTNAVDLAAPSGTPIYAAAPGKVVIARYGWNGGYGNYVVIAHPNGTKTLYAHMRAGGIRTKAGRSVKRGQLIGLIGSTGRSTGPHVHFEVHGARNPF